MAASRTHATRLTGAILFAVLVLFMGPTQVQTRGANGGFTCAGCTFTLTVLGQVSEIRNMTIANAVSKVCSFLPEGVYQGACYALIKVYGPVVIKLLNNKIPPDAACHSMNMCFTEKGRRTCRLAPLSELDLKKYIQKGRSVVKKHLIETNRISFPDICDIPGVRLVCDIINRVSEHNLPGVDLDKDGFSIIPTLRGSLWRGRDCDDTRSQVHPGARPKWWDTFEDTNCNGIYGADKLTARPWEDLYCTGSGQIGVAALGDSVTAHFHIPHQFVNSSEFGQRDYLLFLPFVVENEFDWPMLSSSTGFMQNKWSIIEGPVDSIYMRLRERNHCNHRDFQNLGVNGADSNDMQHIQLSLSRNNKTDMPLLVIYALVGNDVCNWHADDTVAHMTTPEQMRKNFMNTLKFLDTRLPVGSHMLSVGVADGRILYNSLHNRIHPLGNLHKNIRYKDLYNFLNCLLITPCAGWMNVNGTIRNETAKRAAELSDVIQDVSKTYKAKNFDINYVANPLEPVLKRWELIHGKGSVHKLIDAVDGFHPNQYAQALVAEYVWDFMATNLPHYLGDINPYNFDIEKRFGDQGGY